MNHGTPWRFGDVKEDSRVEVGEVTVVVGGHL